MTGRGVLTVHGRRNGRPPHRTPIDLGSLETALQDPCEPSVAMLFLLMARRLPVGVKAYPHRHDPSVWCFKFIQSGVLEVDRNGAGRWISGGGDLRHTVDAVLAGARERAKGAAWYVPAAETPAPANRRQGPSDGPAVHPPRSADTSADRERACG